jgi:hypothetical protein
MGNFLCIHLHAVDLEDTRAASGDAGARPVANDSRRPVRNPLTYEYLRRARVLSRSPRK